jgi:pilus assembly protein Flp/PilA
MIQLISFIQSRLAAASEDDRGAGMVEYGLLVAFIALIALVGVQALGVKLNDLFNGINF